MSSQLSSGTHLHHGAVCRGAFDELTNELWEVELISRCRVSRVQGPAGELQEGLGASWPDDKVAQGVLVVCRQSWDLPTLARTLLSNVRQACGALIGGVWLWVWRGLKFFPLFFFKFYHWVVFLFHPVLLPQMRLLNLQLSIFPSTVQPCN